MTNNEIKIDEYLNSLDDKTKEVFNELRNIAKSILSSHKEIMTYGFPVYDGNGKFGFSAKKTIYQYIFTIIKFQKKLKNIMIN